MEYFTPELIAAYGSDDAATWREAEACWDAVCEKYNAALDLLKPAFPPDLRRLEDNYSLHDAVIRGMGRREGAFVIVLQIDAPPQPLLTLTYDLAEDPIVKQEVLPPDHRSTGGHIDWQYDEIEKALDQPPTWRQSILLSNGWEIVLHFRDVRVEEIQALIPAPRDSAAALSATDVAQSAAG
jgi:hypothetical protein